LKASQEWEAFFRYKYSVRELNNETKARVSTLKTNGSEGILDGIRMKVLGLDLSLRSAGMVVLTNGYLEDFMLVNSDSKSLNEEKLLIYNSSKVIEFVDKHRPDKIGIEGLSFNSLSGSKDLIDGNFWYIRTEIYRAFPKIPVEIIPVKTWRCPLFSKIENREYLDNCKTLKNFKEVLKEIDDKEEKKRLLILHESLILKSNIKWLTYKKLPTDVQEEFGKISFSKGCFDLTDAYHIANFIKD
jgi:hypothetical protein